MIGTTVTFGLDDVLLLAAVVLFVLGALKSARRWMVPIGLACFALSFVSFVH